MKLFLFSILVLISFQSFAQDWGNQSSIVIDSANLVTIDVVGIDKEWCSIRTKATLETLEKGGKLVSDITHCKELVSSPYRVYVSKIRVLKY